MTRTTAPNEPTRSLVDALNFGHESKVTIYNWLLDVVHHPERFVTPPTFMEAVERGLPLHLVRPPQLCELYALYGEAHHLRHVLRQDPKAADEAAIKEGTTWFRLQERLGELEGAIEVLEEPAPELYQRVLNENLERRLGFWEEILRAVVASPHGRFGAPVFEGEDGELDNVEDRSRERDALEFMVHSILLARNDDASRLANVTFFPEFCRRLHESDKLLEQCLGDEREIMPWMPETFWWRHEGGRPSVSASGSGGLQVGD